MAEERAVEVQTLVAKLNTVDFTEEERSLLAALLQAAVGTDSEVEGFGQSLTPAQAAAIVKQAGGIVSHPSPNGPIFTLGTGKNFPYQP